MDRLMTPALPWVYGQKENEEAPAWLKDMVGQVRATNPRNGPPEPPPGPGTQRRENSLHRGRSLVHREFFRISGFPVHPTNK